MAAISNTLPQSLLDAMNPKAASAASTAAEAQDRFLTLLVTQMKNQDPLNPMDNAQVTSQLAQLSTVTGIDKLNSTVESLMGSYQTSQTLQAASLIGKGVLAPGNQTGLSEKQALMGVEFPSDVDSATIEIKDASGKVVQTIDLPAQKAGSQPIIWNGKKADGTDAPDGTYTFDVKATLAGKTVETTELQFGMVATVTTAAGQAVKLNVPGLGELELSDIRQYL
ncbi:flagellar hook assembly protein FlgD [Herminiimonas fonticola]|uniref:Basal-body rod modification protein FlgD n=1 Tax=Herminiimonas fonticola TaxID=303380 RepID=A0A4R6GIN8_9BURK|nr:flagellar hook assembly protein FlgD [Herminiimonas fonticola]RBA25781.1 Flagellar hook capping protein [Herminiimonas fonticola]TDN94889.1 flagellar basal-body rod modification protein FlgD [Herminiimonas fonticola]